MDGAKARAMHQGDARANGAKQEKPRTLHHHENNEGAIVEVPLGQIEECFSETLLRKVEEVDREEGCCEKVGREGDREEADSEEARNHLFAFEESRLELKDEQSS